MIKGIGVDLLEIARIKEMNQESLANKILLPTEKAQYDRIVLESVKVEFLASRFCAKEACFKALSSVLDVPFYKIEIKKDQQGIPYGQCGEYKVLLSISHENNYVVAYAIYQ